MSPISRVTAGAWPITPLRDVCEVVTGSTPPRGESRYFGGSVPWIKPEDLDTSLYVVGSKEYLTDDGARLARKVPKGSVLVSCIGNIGKVAIAGVDLAVNQQINCLVPGPRVVSEYLYYAMRFGRGNLQNQASNTIVPILNKSRFAAVGIPLPPLADQKRIVAKLDEQMAALDRAEKALAEQQATASILTTAVLQQAFSGSESTRWPQVALGQVLSLEYGRGLPESVRIPGECPVMGSNGIVGYHNEYLVSGPTIIVGRKGSSGKVTWVDRNCFPIDTTYFVAPKTESPVLRFLYFFLKWSNLGRLSEASGVPGLNRDRVYELLCPIPPFVEQSQIVNRIEAADSSVVVLVEHLAEVKSSFAAMRTALLDAAFSGEI